MKNQTCLVIFTIGVLLFTNTTVLGQSITISGIVSDSANGENLIGCSVFLADRTVGSVTNNYGYYSIEIPSGNQKLVYSFIGYKTDTIDISIAKNIVINHVLTPSYKSLSIVTIESQSSENKSLGKNQITVVELKTIPAVMGECDVMKGIQLLPGVQTAAEGSTNLSIRGGTHDQNLILLDEAPIYNPSHVLSLVSAFNVDALRKVDIYKGAIPAQYGGKLSSVIDLRMKEGNNKKVIITGGIGVIASRLTIESPIIKNKTSIMLSGRYGYPGNTLNGIRKLNDIPKLSIPQLNNIPDNNIVWFYDLNFKLNHKINSKNKVYLSAYTSQDEFELRPLDANSNIRWGNTTFTGRWNQIVNDKVFVNHSIIYSEYNYSYYRLSDYNNYYWNSGLQEYDYKIDFDNFYNSKNYLKYGAKIGFNRFLPGEIKQSDGISNYKEFTLHDQKTISADIYISDKYKINNKTDISIGLRYSSLINIGEDMVQNYDASGVVTDTSYYSKGELIKYHYGFEPRLLLSYKLKKNMSIQASYTRSIQYVHLLSNSSLGLPTDVWFPANTHIAPSTSNQYSLGYYILPKELNIDMSIEVYYRVMNDIIDFVDNANLFINTQIETQLLSGKRKSYGAEFLLKKETGKLKGWFSYTLSKTEQKVDGVNNNNWYPAFFDKRHNLSIFLNYQLSKYFKIATVFKFTTGGNMTVPINIFHIGDIPFVEYSDRNAYQLPNYHRLDLSLSYSSKKNNNRKWKSEWEFGIYNAYNRKNVFSIDAQLNHTYNMKINKIYLYGIVPYLTYNFKI